MSDLYETDILLWSERQTYLLRRVAVDEPVREKPDWLNIIEEIADVGRSELRACRSLLRQALRNMLKAEAWPLSGDARLVARPSVRDASVRHADIVPPLYSRMRTPTGIIADRSEALGPRDRHE